MPQALLVLVNVPDENVAHAIARSVVEQGLAACVNLLPTIRSVYRWQGAVEEATEITLMIKTVEARYSELEVAIRGMHPYDVPEIIALPIVAGLAEYLGWVAAETKKDVNV